METNERGFTLIEVLVAMVILGFTLLGVQAAITDRLVRDVGRQDWRATAEQLAASRLAAAQSDPDYAGLPGKYQATEDTIARMPGFRRTTRVAVGSGYTTVSVRVIGPGERDTIDRTVVIGAP